MARNLLINVENMGIQFGGLKAVQGVNMYLNQGELVGLIGPNGAGKSTFLKILSGEIEANTGDVHITPGFIG